jgi:hypothetical protein
MLEVANALRPVHLVASPYGRSEMHFVLHAMLLAFAALLAQPGVAKAQAHLKQIRLTEKQVQGFISAQKDMVAITKKMLSVSDKPDPKIQAQLEDAAKKQGFKDFDEYDDVAFNISLIMTGIDPQTKKYTEPRVEIQQEIAEITANPTMSAEEKKQVLDQLNQELKAAVPIEYPSNIDLVLQYYDKIEAALQ